MKEITWKGEEKSIEEKAADELFYMYKYDQDWDKRPDPVADIDENLVALSLIKEENSSCDQECTLDWILSDAREIDMIRDGINYMKHEKNEIYSHIDYWNNRMKSLDTQIILDEHLLKEKLDLFNQIKLDEAQLRITPGFKNK